MPQRDQKIVGRQVENELLRKLLSLSSAGHSGLGLYVSGVQRNSTRIWIWIQISIEYSTIANQEKLDNGSSAAVAISWSVTAWKVSTLFMS